MVFLDKHGWPVERIIGRPITNFIRLVLHTKKIKQGFWNGYGVVAAGKLYPTVLCENKWIDNSVGVGSGPTRK